MEGQGVNRTCVDLVYLCQGVRSEVVDPDLSIRHGCSHQFLWVPHDLLPVGLVVDESVLTGSRLYVKHTARLVLGTGGDQVLVERREPGTTDKVPVLCEGLDQFFVTQFPQFDGLVIAACKKVITGSVQVDRPGR